MRSARVKKQFLGNRLIPIVEHLFQNDYGRPNFGIFVSLLCLLLKS